MLHRRKTEKSKKRTDGSRVLWDWAKRNEDKPHRCPKCHAIAVLPWLRSMEGRGYGPRTVFACCGVKWRAGTRVRDRGMARKVELKRDFREWVARIKVDR